MYKQAPKSPAMKALVGNQKNLPAGLKAQIKAAPGKMMSPAKNMNKGYGSPAKQTFRRTLEGTKGSSIVNPESSSRRTLEGLKSKKLELKVTKKKKPITIKPRAKEEIAKIPVKTASIPQSKSKSKLAVVNTTKPAEPKTKKQVRRAKRADKLESRAEKLRGTAQKSSPAKQVGAPELKATTKKKSGLSAVALANAGRDILKSDYGIDDPNMSNKAIADSIKKYKRTDEVRSKVKQGLKKGDNEGDFAASFGSPVRMKSPAKQTKKVLTPKQKLALRKTMDDVSKKDFKKRIEGTKIKPVGPFDGTKPKQTAPIFTGPRPKNIPFKRTNVQKSK